MASNCGAGIHVEHFHGGPQKRAGFHLTRNACGLTCPSRILGWVEFGLKKWEKSVRTYIWKTVGWFDWELSEVYCNPKSRCFGFQAVSLGRLKGIVTLLITEMAKTPSLMFLTMKNPNMLTSFKKYYGYSWCPVWETMVLWVCGSDWTPFLGVEETGCLRWLNCMSKIMSQSREIAQFVKALWGPCGFMPRTHMRGEKGGTSHPGQCLGTKRGSLWPAQLVSRFQAMRTAASMEAG